MQTDYVVKINFTVCNKITYNSIHVYYLFDKYGLFLKVFFYLEIKTITRKELKYKQNFYNS